MKQGAAAAKLRRNALLQQIMSTQMPLVEHSHLRFGRLSTAGRFCFETLESPGRWYPHQHPPRVTPALSTHRHSTRHTSHTSTYNSTRLPPATSAVYCVARPAAAYCMAAAYCVDCPALGFAWLLCTASELSNSFAADLLIQPPKNGRCCTVLLTFQNCRLMCAAGRIWWG